MILVIHNPMRNDRAVILEQELLSQGIKDDVIFVNAVTDGRSPVRNISRAHKTCVRMAKEAGVDHVIILEDDVHFLCPKSFARFIELSKHLPPDWDIFLSGAYDAHIEPYSEHLRRVTKFSGLHCYMVNSRYYDYFLSASEIINIDKWMSTPGYGKSNAYLAYPMLIMQHDGFSDNVRRMTDYNKNIRNRYEFWKCTD